MHNESLTFFVTVQNLIMSIFAKYALHVRRSNPFKPLFCLATLYPQMKILQKIKKQSTRYLKTQIIFAT